MLSKLAESLKVVGAKQTKRALTAGQADTVYLAADADPQLTDAIRDLCAQHEIPVCDVPTMKELGKACGIAVGAAVAARIH